MRKIPNEGEFCGECPCLDEEYGECQVYPDDKIDTTTLQGDTDGWKRLPICLKERQQIIPGAVLDRIEFLFSSIMSLAAEGPEVTDRKDLLQAIIKEAQRGIEVVKGRKKSEESI